MHSEFQIEKRDRENGPGHIFEKITSENFQISWENIRLQIQDFSELHTVEM